MTENRIFTLCRMITWVVFLRMFWNFISSLPVKRGGSLSFLVGTISNVLVMEIGWTDVGSEVYILVSCAHSNTSCFSHQSILLYLYYYTYQNQNNSWKPFYKCFQLVQVPSNMILNIDQTCVSLNIQCFVRTNTIKSFLW